MSDIDTDPATNTSSGLINFVNESILLLHTFVKHSHGETFDEGVIRDRLRRMLAHCCSEQFTSEFAAYVTNHVLNTSSIDEHRTN